MSEAVVKENNYFTRKDSFWFLCGTEKVGGVLILVGQILFGWFEPANMYDATLLPVSVNVRYFIWECFSKLVHDYSSRQFVTIYALPNKCLFYSADAYVSGFLAM